MNSVTSEVLGDVVVDGNSSSNGAAEYFEMSHDTPLGTLRLVGSNAGLRAVLWPDEIDRVVLPATTVGRHPVLDAAADQLDEYFAGKRVVFDLDLDLHGTEFQVLAWNSLADIPHGQTATYAEQAASIGRPKAVRAIGAANGRNPVSIVLPCHLVVGANGSLTGFAGGLDAKRFLLEHESGQATLDLN